MKEPILKCKTCKYKYIDWELPPCRNCHCCNLYEEDVILKALEDKND